MRTKSELDQRTKEEKDGTYTENLVQMHTLRLDKERNITEISERESTLKEKLGRIQDLRKKIQELEKFKFVLDYKIKDLKRDIAPREAEINRLKADTRKMDDKLKSCNAINSSYGVLVDDLRTR